MVAFDFGRDFNQSMAARGSLAAQLLAMVEMTPFRCWGLVTSLESAMARFGSSLAMIPMTLERAWLRDWLLVRLRAHSRARSRFVCDLYHGVASLV